jgi:DNA-binding response OmpR family regulator
MTKRILIVEDDAPLAQLLSDNLVYEGYLVDLAASGTAALQRIAAPPPPDLVLLDVMLPDLNGFEICRRLGAGEASGPSRTPIIILTAIAEKSDKVRGLELGADDYVTKPFALDELLARIHAVLRRSRRAVTGLVLGEVTVDFRLLRATRRGRDLELTRREIELLHCLAEREGKVVTRDELLRLVWRYTEVPLTRTVDNFIARLRRKIEEDPHHPRYLRTAHGDGYSLVQDPAGRDAREG